MIITIKANIEKPSVLRFLGYKDINKVPNTILAKVDSVLNKIPEILGNIIYDEFKFGLDAKNKKILLNERNSFCGDKIFKTLSDCNSLVIAISTLENDFKKIYEKIASGGVIYEMIIDAIGTAALNDINNRFCIKLVDEYKHRGYGLTERLAPGDNNWSLADQKTIFSVLDGNRIGVKLNEKYIMEPEKSLTMVYGIKEGKSSSLKEHNCEKCSLTSCSFRKEPQKHTLKILLNGKEKSIQAKHGEKLFDVLAKNNISTPNSCGGNHTCGKCLVQVYSPISDSISDKENELLKRINAFVIDEKTRIVITQADIRELQLAKAAIFAGIQVLADKASINLEEIENVYLAGGFGNFLDLNSAFTIKLLPQEFEGKIIPIGNGAGIGAKIVLSFEDALSLLNTILVKMEYIELSISPEFQEKFIKAINF